LKKRVSRISNNSGQSTVEFVLSFVLFFSFVLFYFQLCMVFAFGNFVHYATFMSARAYLAASSDRFDQRDRAREVLVSMVKKSVGQAGVDKFPSIARGFGQGDPGGFQVDPPSQYEERDRALSWMQGDRYTFKSNLFMSPLAGLGKAGTTSNDSLNSLTLTSESWLGREPADDECRGDMGKKKWIFDNGC